MTSPGTRVERQAVTYKKVYTTERTGDTGNRPLASASSLILLRLWPNEIPGWLPWGGNLICALFVFVPAGRNGLMNASGSEKRKVAKSLALKGDIFV